MKYGVTSCKCGSAKEPFEVRLRRSRLNATIRERQRLAKINRLLEWLSSAVPEEFQGLATKADVIRGAADYIWTLTTLLREMKDSDDTATAQPMSSARLNSGRRNKIVGSDAIAPAIRRSTLTERTSPFHLDPKSHSSLIIPGVVKMNEPSPSVVVDWNPANKTPSTEKHL